MGAVLGVSKLYSKFHLRVYAHTCFPGESVAFVSASSLTKHISETLGSIPEAGTTLPPGTAVISSGSGAGLDSLWMTWESRFKRPE